MEESDDGDISGDAGSEDDDEMGQPDEEDEEDEDAIVARALGKLPGNKSDKKPKKKGASSEPEEGEFKRVKHNIDDEFLNLDEMNRFLDEQVKPHIPMKRPVVCSVSGGCCWLSLVF